MKFMIDGGSSAPLPKARKWLIKYPEASRELLDLLKDKVVDYLVEQVRAGAQVIHFSYLIYDKQKWYHTTSEKYKDLIR